MLKQSAALLLQVMEICKAAIKDPSSVESALREIASLRPDGVRLWAPVRKKEFRQASAVRQLRLNWDTDLRPLLSHLDVEDGVLMSDVQVLLSSSMCFR